TVRERFVEGSCFYSCNRCLTERARSSCSGCGSSLRRNPLAGACQKALCLGNGASDDVFGRGDVLNEGDGFSGNHRRGIEVASLASARELGNDVLTPHQLQLAAEP